VDQLRDVHLAAVQRVGAAPEGIDVLLRHRRSIHIPVVQLTITEVVLSTLFER
jgi:hypothetical protein